MNIPSRCGRITPGVQEKSKGNYKAAVKFFESAIAEYLVELKEIAPSVQDNGVFSEMHVKIAESYYLIGDCEKALDAATAAIKEDSRSAEGFRIRAKTYTRLGKVSLAGADREAADQFSQRAHEREKFMDEIKLPDRRGSDTVDGARCFVASYCKF